MIKKLFRNLFSRAEVLANEAEQSAKDYAYSLRPLDFANVESPISANVSSDWTYTATKDGVLNLSIAFNARTYVQIAVNGFNISNIAQTVGTGQPIIPISVCVTAGDVVTVTGLGSSAYLFTASRFIPFSVGGVILNLFHALSERGCLA